MSGRIYRPYRPYGGKKAGGIASLSPAIWLTDTGSDASIWEDVSGNGRHATQGTGSLRPAIVADVKNGRQVRRFANDWMIIDHLFEVEEFTVFLVWQANGTNQRIIDQRGTGGYGTVKGWHVKSRNSGDVFIVDDGGTNASSRRAVDLNPSAADWHLSNLRNQESVAEFWIDGVLEASDAATQGDVATTKRIHLGANVNGQTSQRFNGDLGSVVVFDRALTDPERLVVQAQLVSEWGL